MRKAKDEDKKGALDVAIVGKKSAQTAVAVREDGALTAPLSVAQMRERVDLIRAVIKEVMVEGQDYGVIPGCGDKPTLYQAGAQKLSMMFSLNPEVREEEVTDYPNNHRGFRTIVRVTAGGKSAEGVGECSTLESKYRFRSTQLSCPKCGKAAIIKGKQEFGGGWVCYKAKGGCGEKWSDGTDQAAKFSKGGGKVEYDNPPDHWNCVPLNTRILTRKGFQSHDQIVVGQDVLSYNCRTGLCEWVPLLSVTKFESAPLVRLSNKTTELICTPNHKWAAGLPAKLVPTLSLGKRDIIRAAKAPGGRHPMTARRAAILGWLLTDGNIRPGGYCTITQAQHRYADEIKLLLGNDASSIKVRPAREMEIGGVVALQSELCVFNLRAKFSQALLEEAGIKSKHEIPLCLTELTSEARAAMLLAMVHADGHFRKSLKGNGFCGGSWLFTKQIPAVMETFRILATLEGYKLSRAHGQITWSGAFQPRQELCASRFTNAKHLSIEHKPNAPVWCPTTKHGTWVMEQDGNVSITGNTARKIAFKRAFVHAIINATNTSELWTQDLEDLAGNGVFRNAEAPQPDAPEEGRGGPPQDAPKGSARAQGKHGVKIADWRVVKIQSGKMKGTGLGELKPDDLNYYIQKWDKDKPDSVLRRALDMAEAELHGSAKSAGSGSLKAPAGDYPDWRDAVILHGKANKGKKLGELKPDSLAWYIENWDLDEATGRPKDTPLRRALDQAKQWLESKGEGQPDAPPDDWRPSRPDNHGAETPARQPSDNDGGADDDVPF